MKQNLKQLLCAALFLISFSSFAQQNVTLYNMRSLPQRMYANPALRPDAKMFINVPLLSSHHINFGNTSLNFDKLVETLEPNGDSNTLNASKLGSLFNDRNLITLSYDLDVFHAGFKVGNNYFAVNGTLKNGMKFDYPGDFFDLVVQGNGGANLDRDFDLSVGFDAMQYFELGFAWNRDFMDDRLRLGARLKLLNGMNNFNTARSNLTFNTASDDFTLTLKPDIEIRMASEFIPITNDGFFGDSTGDPDPGVGSVFGFSNFGTGLDLGAVYEYSEKIHLSAALNNLGAIKWNTNTFIVRSSRPGQSVQFTGVQLDNILDSADGEFGDILDQLGDSLNAQIDFDTLHDSYTTYLNPEFYLGANYNITKNHNAAILFYGNFYRKKFYPAATISINSRFTRILSASLTYSYLNKSFTNAGAGLSLSLGPTQWYFVSDNLFSAFRPSKHNNINLRFGMNLTFRRKVKEGDA